MLIELKAVSTLATAAAPPTHQCLSFGPQNPTVGTETLRCVSLESAKRIVVPSQKNQHFVPRCALKPFTLNGKGVAINLFNIAGNRAIQNGPVKHQCARDYIYGKDLFLENKLSVLEARYAGIVAQLSASGGVSEEDAEWLLLFVVLQWRRTEQAIEHMREWGRAMDDAVFRQHPEQKPDDPRTDADMMHLSLRVGVQLVKYAKDLKLVIFRNRSSIDFVVCDSPSILTNKFYLHRMKRDGFGVSNSGALFSMPLSPRLSALWYDVGVYSIPNASGTPFVDINRSTDVDAFNQLQFLSARHNIYFARWEDHNRISTEVRKVTQLRTGATAEATIFVRDYGQVGESYRRGTLDEELAAHESLVATSVRHPVPTIWPSVLKFRGKPRVFSNGSATGYVRKAEWLSGAMNPLT